MSYASAGCRYYAPENTRRSYEAHTQEEEWSIFLRCLTRSSTDPCAPCLTHSLCRQCAHLNRYRPFTHTGTYAHIGNSSCVGVQIKTNADESSFCEPHRCFAAGAVLPQEGEIHSIVCFAWMVASGVRFSPWDCRVLHFSVFHMTRVGCWGKRAGVDGDQI